MNTTEQSIINYANANKSFQTNDLFECLSHEIDITKKTLSWYLNKLVASKQLYRQGRGIYSVEVKQSFCPVPNVKSIKIFKMLIKRFPLLNICVYNGEILAPLQHHLSYNNNIYVETDRDGAETVFHALQDNQKSVFFSPTKEMMSEYVQYSKNSIIVKPMVSESPLQKSSGIIIPTIEKLLVDIQCDTDFFYFQGIEADYMMDNAFLLYNVNTNMLLRYASRRNLKSRIEQYIDNKNK